MKTHWPFCFPVASPSLGTGRDSRHSRQPGFSGRACGSKRVTSRIHSSGEASQPGEIALRSPGQEDVGHASEGIQPPQCQWGPSDRRLPQIRTRVNSSSTTCRPQSAPQDSTRGRRLDEVEEVEMPFEQDQACRLPRDDAEQATSRVPMSTERQGRVTRNWKQQSQGRVMDKQISGYCFGRRATRSGGRDLFLGISRTAAVEARCRAAEVEHVPRVTSGQSTCRRSSPCRHDQGRRATSASGCPGSPTSRCLCSF